MVDDADHFQMCNDVITAVALERLPKDPWGNPYQYLSPGLRGEIDVFSFGADGAPGGAGIDADVGSWDL